MSKFPPGVVPPPKKYIDEPVKKKVTQMVGKLRFVIKFSDGLIKTEVVVGHPGYPTPITAMDMWALYLEDEARTCGYYGNYIVEAKILSHNPQYKEEYEMTQRYERVSNPEYENWEKEHKNEWDRWIREENLGIDPTKSFVSYFFDRPFR